MRDADISVSLYSNIACRLGEGPTYDATTNTLWWFNIVGRELHEHDMESGVNRVHQLPFMASAMGITSEGQQLIAADNGFHLRDPATGALDLVAALEADNPVTRSNDGRVHPSGALWIGTMGRNAEPEAGAIYRFFRGETTLLYPRITIPNSICFSPDAGIAYFADTMREVIHRVRIDPVTALPAGEPEVFVDRRGGRGGIDGSVTDADGNLWNARWGAGKVDCYSPAGDHLLSLHVPASQASCPAFAGPAFDRLAVTSAWQGMDEAKRAADPKAGFTFLLDHPVRGRSEPHVIL